MSPRQWEWLNVVAVTVAFCGAVLGSTFIAQATTIPQPTTIPLMAQVSSTTRSASPRYQRIVAADLVADDIVSILVERDRLIAVSPWGTGPEQWRLAGLPQVDGLSSLERLLSLRPDLVIITPFGSDADRIARLRGAIIAVSDLMTASGTAAFIANVRRVGNVIGEPLRAEKAIAGLQQRAMVLRQRQYLRRLHSGSATNASTPLWRGLILSPTADQIYGGTSGSSFHDLLVLGGLTDVAAGRFIDPWPRLDVEWVRTLDPDVIVTRSGAAALIARIPGFASVRAVANQRIIEIPDVLFNSPGLHLYSAAEQLDQQVAELMQLQR